MTIHIEHELPSQQRTGARVKGEFCCSACGYGVAVYRELPLCPMCAGDRWEPAPWRPFTRGATLPAFALAREGAAQRGDRPEP